MTARPDDDQQASTDGASEPAEPEAQSSPTAATAADAAPADVTEADATQVPAPDDREPELPPITVDRDDVQVQARLVPRYGRFMVLGAIVGGIGGYVWSRFGSSGPLLGTGPVIDTSAMIPFLIGVGALVGIVLGAAVAILLDRVVGRRRRTVTAVRTRHHRGDEHDD